MSFEPSFCVSVVPDASESSDFLTYVQSTVNCTFDAPVSSVSSVIVETFETIILSKVRSCVITSAATSLLLCEIVIDTPSVVTDILSIRASDGSFFSSSSIKLTISSFLLDDAS